MSLDTEDTPMGAIIGLSFITLIVFVVVVITFDSCTDFEKDEITRYCQDVLFQLDKPHGETTICYDDNKNLRLAIVNTGDIPFEGFNFAFFSLSVNRTTDMPRFTQKEFTVPLGLRAGIEFNYINVTPIVFYEPFNSTVLCTAMTQRVKRLSRCGIID